jgi:hypothetical protein
MFTIGHSIGGTPLGRGPFLGDQEARFSWGELERIADVVVAEIDAVNALCQFAFQPNSHLLEGPSEIVEFEGAARQCSPAPACARF